MLFKEEQAFEGAQRASGEGGWKPVWLFALDLPKPPPPPTCSRNTGPVAPGNTPGDMGTADASWERLCQLSGRLFHDQPGLDNNACMLKVKRRELKQNVERQLFTKKN